MDKLDAYEPVHMPFWYFGGGSGGPDCGPTWQWQSIATYVLQRMYEADDCVTALSWQSPS
ncbi:hypothetical protein A5712_00325 [Mycobacterium sp. E2327]|nr:hypothetical protein A5712_00325 [Mycobacterium sp. E2327]